MQATLDRFGRIVIPQPVRAALGLDAGTVLEIEQQGEAVLLRPCRPEPDLIIEDGILVYNGSAEGDLEQALEAERERRLQRLEAELEG